MRKQPVANIRPFSPCHSSELRRYFAHRCVFSLAILCCLLSIGALYAQDSSVVTPSAYPSDIPVNYTRTWEALSPQSSPNTLIGGGISAVKQATQYIDGLGRPIQTVLKKGAYPTNGSAVDMVSPVIYDEFGREVRKYLPFAANTTGSNTSVNDGLFKLNPFQQQNYFYSDGNSSSPIRGQGEAYYYNKTDYEASPLNRVNKVFAAGNAWVNQARATTVKSWANKTTDSVRIWTISNNTNSFGSYTSSAMYAAGQLIKTITSDESNNQVIEFKDRLGNLILRKVLSTSAVDTGLGKGHTGWLCTYYVYDDLNQLRAVVQPLGVELLVANSWDMTALSGAILNEQTFRYEYDNMGRMTMKKVPGSGIVYMVYDVRDRLVFTQDSMLRTQNKWLATLYDNLNRPVVTGLMTFSGSRSALQDTVSTKTLTPGSPATNLALDLVLTGTNQSGTKQAMRSISMESDFETTTGGSFTAELNPGPNGPDGETTVIEGTIVNKSPIPIGASFEVLSNMFYDNYDWQSYYSSSLSSTRVTSYDSHLLTASNSSFPYAQAVTQSTMLKGLVTGTRTKVLGTASDYLYSASFYDDKGRVIQVQRTNITGGTDIATTQYSFAGHPLVMIAKVEKKGTSPQTSVVVTKNSYDSLWRIAKIEKKLSNDSVNTNVMSSYVTVVENEYNALGQLSKKKLGNNLDTLTYDYNIRGWLLGMNRRYARDVHERNYFGFDLGYDKASNGIIGNKTYTPQYNGNISGTVWKSAGDQAKRKYDFSYDAVNRLTSADFNQYTSGDFTKLDGIDFSVSGLSYDANGNIKSMKQRGLKGTASETIDSLVYSYMNSGNSNKLLNVIDGRNDAQTKLGDFRTSALHPNSGSKNSSTVDYGYDGNGNMVMDLNKDIVIGSNTNGIVYNHLNLPQQITVKGTSGTKGTIVYTMDAGGNKLKKVVTEGSLVTTTLYLNGLEYKNDTLQYIAQEEGRIRFTPGSGSVAAKFSYDYFLKDHLGNIRMVLTEERKQDVYPAATLEGSLANSNDAIYVENQYYTINSANVVSKSEATGITDYANNNGNPPYNVNPNGNATANSQKLYKLQATGGVGVTGLGMTLKVMTGDTLNIFGKSYYFDNNTGGSNYSIPVLDILSGLLGAPTGVTGGKGVTAGGLNDITPIYNAVNGFLGDGGRGGGTTPKASINWILFDEQFRVVNSNFSRVGSAGTVKSHWNSDPALQNIPVSKNGYLYVYCSNESPVKVFFDNVQVVHNHGAILEETHYYPFGLTMAGISSRALGGVENKIKFQGQEFASKEFSDGSGLEMYEFKYRMDDPQTGRFWQIDPLAEKYVHNSTYAFSENKVTSHIELEGLESVAMNAVWRSSGFNSSGGMNPNSDLGKFYSWGNLPNVMSKSMIALGGIYAALDGFGFGLSGISFSESASLITAEANAGGLARAYTNAMEAGASVESINALGVDAAKDAALAARANTARNAAIARSELEMSNYFSNLNAISAESYAAMESNIAGLQSGARNALNSFKSSDYLYHYTSPGAAQSISQFGYSIGENRPFAYLTDIGNLTPRQANIQLALPSYNQANSILRFDVQAMQQDGINPFLIRRVTGNLPGYGAGGGTEYLFNQYISPNYIQWIK